MAERAYPMIGNTVVQDIESIAEVADHRLGPADEAEHDAGMTDRIARHRADRGA